MPPKVPRTPAKKENQQDDAEDLETLVYLRQQEHQRLVRLKEKLAGLAERERTATQINVHKETLNEAKAEFKFFHGRIVRLDTKKREEHSGKSFEFEELCVEIAIMLEGWNQTLAIPAGPPNAPVPTAQTPVVIQQSLPRPVPTFDGQYKNWKRFKTMFRDVVDRSNETPRMKLYHLEKALIEDAKGAIDEKTIEDGNYDHAWELLEERYEDNRRMVDIHIGGLLKVQKVSKESHTELRSLVENVNSHVENLKYLGQEFLGVSEQFVVYLLVHALDDDTRKLLEATIVKGELPKYDDTMKFLKNRVSVLERCEKTVDTDPKQHTRADVPTQPYRIANTARSQPGPRCDLCGDTHLTFKCATFTSLPVCQRMEKVKERRVCFNCLRAGHRAKKCRRTSSCGKCQRRHHTLLHDVYVKPTTPLVLVPAVSRPVRSPPAEVKNNPTPMLQTAVVDLRDGKNRPVPCRILLDTGSQENFISSSMANRLNLRRVAAHVPICGIGGVTACCKESISVKLQSRYSGFTADVECLVIPKVSGKIPASPVNATDWPIPQGFQLADSEFHSPGPIDMLIGASWYFRLLKEGHLQMWDNFPELRETHLGWVVVGGGGDTGADQQFA